MPTERFQDEHPDYPRIDWVFDMATLEPEVRASYWTWVNQRIAALDGHESVDKSRFNQALESEGV
jgi:hypothetical protein